MAIQLNAATNDLEITTGILDYQSDFTVSFWYKINTDGNTFSSAFIITAASSPTNTDNIKLASDGTSLRAIRQVSGGTTQQTGTSLTVGTWYNITAVGTSSALTMYLNGVSDAVATASNAGRAAAISMQFNGNSVGLTDNHQDMSIFGVKAWTSALTVDEINNEMQTILPQRREDLYGCWPLLDTNDDVTDYSGNGNDWTLTGATSTAQNAPISWTETVPALSQILAVTNTVSPAMTTVGTAALTKGTIFAKALAMISLGVAALSKATIPFVPSLLANISKASVLRKVILGRRNSRSRR